MRIRQVGRWGCDRRLRWFESTHLEILPAFSRLAQGKSNPLIRDRRKFNSCTGYHERVWCLMVACWSSKPCGESSSLSIRSKFWHEAKAVDASDCNSDVSQFDSDRAIQCPIRSVVGPRACNSLTAVRF